MKIQIKEYLNKYVSFSDAEIETICAKLKTKSYQKKAFLLEEGQVCKSKFFIIKGLVRVYYIDNKGSEKITQFAIENWWVSNTESFVKETQSISFIQALEETEVCIINKEDLDKLYLSVPKLERFFRIITENMLIAIQRRSDVYLQMKSKDRYLDFISHFPDFTQRVPQYMIASYLEITPEYLSELRKV